MMDKDIFFSAYTDIQSKKPILTSFLKVMDSIKNGTYKNQLERLRTAKKIVSQEQYQDLKKTLPCFTIGVNNSKEGKGDPLPEDLTGLVCLDIDNKSQDQRVNKEKLKQIPWVLAVGNSAGGEGLFAAVKGPANKHRETFRNAAKLLGSKGLEVNVADGQQNENRLRYMTWDPDLYFVPDPVAAPCVPEIEMEIPINPEVKTVQNNDKRSIFEKIVKIISKGKTIWIEGERHYHLGKVISWCNHIGMSIDFVDQLMDEICRPMMENGQHYQITDQLGDFYRRYSHQHNTKAWKDDGIEPVSVITDSTVFIPTWNNKPLHIPPVIKLGGINILTFQNISGIIASPGSGKTSCMEAIAASFLNPQKDCLGFEVDALCKGILVIDTERTPTDVWNSFNRMCRRAGIGEGDPVKGVKIVGMRGVSNVDERKQKIESFIRNKEYSLLLIDGIADLVRDTNNVDQAKDAQGWLRYLTATYGISILGTIHPNPGSDKARGHTGAELLRDAETVLAIKEEKGAKIITSNFDYGKNRNTGKITYAIIWSDELRMFISSNMAQMGLNGSAKSPAKYESFRNLAKLVLPQASAKRSVELVAAIRGVNKKGVRTAESIIGDMNVWGIIEKKDDCWRSIL